ncbi:MAG: hypothetical protein R2712_29380 [Vicinamibacterales bacterium]
MVKDDVVRRCLGVAVIPLSDGRGILALESWRGVSELELAVIDRLRVEGHRQGRARGPCRPCAATCSSQWRLEGVHFESRTVIVAQRAASADGDGAGPRRHRR